MNSSASNTATNRGLRKMENSSKCTSTPEEFNWCEKCKSVQTEKLEDITDQGTIIEDYLTSLQYINTCHTLINQIIQSRNPPQNISIPQMPNFLNVLTYIAKDVGELSDMKTLNSLESKMQTMSTTSLSSKLPSAVAIGSQASRCTVDREIESIPPECSHMETSMTKVIDSSMRINKTGIPRRITICKSESSEMNKSPKLSPATIRFKLPEETADDVQSESPVLSEDIMELPIAAEAGECCDSFSEKESNPISNDEFDEYAKHILLATDTPSYLDTSSDNTLRKKVRKEKSKSKRDFAMIKSFLNQFGISMPDLNDEKNIANIQEFTSSAYSRGREKKESTSIKSIHRIKRFGPESVLEEDSDVDTTVMESKSQPDEYHSIKMSICSRSSRGSNDSNPHNHHKFNDLAASAEGLENTFITNEVPVWQTCVDLDESDIEPDKDEEKSALEPILDTVSICSKSLTLQTNPKATYQVKQKPQDLFLMPRTRRSISDPESDRVLEDSDIDDDLFDRKRRPRGVLKLRSRGLPQKVLSNIGILTHTGRVKPERERQLQELRSRLSTDMQTPLFRKPRNRKLETDDIVHLHTELRVTEKK